MTEFQETSRYRRIAAGNMLPPAQCFGCGSISDDNGFIDPQVLIEWYGNLYICMSCCVNLGEAAGCTTPLSSAALRAELDQANAEVDELRSRLSAMEASIDALSADRLRDRIASGVADPALFNDVTSAGDVIFDGDSEGLTDSESSESVKIKGSSEPSGSERPDDLTDSLGL